MGVVGGHAFVVEGLHPAVEFGAEASEFGCCGGVVGEVFEFLGVGLEVVEFLGGAVVVFLDEFGGGGVGLGFAFPGAPIAGVGLDAVDVGVEFQAGVEVRGCPAPAFVAERCGWGRSSCFRLRCGWRR